MANPHRGELAITVGGRPYVLSYTTDSLVELEEALGQGIIAIMNELQAWAKDPTKVRLKWVRAMFWAGLHERHPDITIFAAGDLITEVDGKTMGVLELCGRALGMAFGAPEAEMKGGDPQQGPASNGTGTGSSSTTSASALTPEDSGGSPLVN